MLVGFPIFGAGIVVIPLIATLIYTHVYNKRANKIINSDFSKGIVSKKPMMSPAYFFAIWLVAMVFLICVFIVIGCIAYSTNTNISNETEQTNSFNFQSYDKDSKNQGFLSDITADKEIKGYKRFVEKDDNFILTYYISSTGDFNFPEVIVNVKYTGSTDPFNIHGDCQIDSCGQGIYTEGKDLDNNSQWFTINRGNMIDDDVDLTFDIYDAKKYNADNFDEDEQNPSATTNLNLTSDEIEDIIE